MGEAQVPVEQEPSVLQPHPHPWLSLPALLPLWLPHQHQGSRSCLICSPALEGLGLIEETDPVGFWGASTPPPLGGPQAASSGHPQQRPNSLLLLKGPEAWSIRPTGPLCIGASPLVRLDIPQIQGKSQNRMRNEGFSEKQWLLQRRQLWIGKALSLCYPYPMVPCMALQHHSQPCSMATKQAVWEGAWCPAP